MTTKTPEQRAYELWKRENDLDGRGYPHAPVLPSESTAARMADESARLAAQDEQ